MFGLASAGGKVGGIDDGRIGVVLVRVHYGRMWELNSCEWCEQRRFEARQRFNGVDVALESCADEGLMESPCAVTAAIKQRGGLGRKFDRQIRAIREAKQI